MKTIILTIIAVSITFTGSKALADGFKCEGVNTGINVMVYNHTSPSDGTRSLAVMIVSDSYVNSPNKTIAKFTDENKTLANLGHGLFQAKVDLRYIESNKKGENIAGTKLGKLTYINLQVYIDSSHPHKDGDVLNAKLSYIKRDGEILDEKAICTRYLKN